MKITPNASRNAAMSHNVNTLRCRTGMSRASAEDFLQGRRVSSPTDRHICRRFGLGASPEIGDRRGQAGVGHGGHPPAASLGTVGSGGHIRPSSKPVGGVFGLGGTPSGLGPLGVVRPGHARGPSEERIPTRSGRVSR